MKPIFKKGLIVLLILIIVGAIITPLVVYHNHFKDFSKSNDPAMWGVFGDYMGGLLNPIISLVSLLILTYLMYYVTVKANKQLFVVERRMNAYEELYKHIREINSVPYKNKNIQAMRRFDEVIRKMRDSEEEQGEELKVTKNHHTERLLDNLYDEIKELRKLSNIYSELHLTLKEFSNRYGVLFKFDFECQDYKDLLNESDRMRKLMEDLQIQEPTETRDLTEYVFKDSFRTSLKVLVEGLRNEISSEIKL